MRLIKEDYFFLALKSFPRYRLEGMSYNFYSLFHLGSILALSLLLGGLWGLSASPSINKKLKSFLLGGHGLLMFFIFFAGFGLIAKIQLDFPWPLWIYGKMIIWLLLALSPFFIRKASQKSQLSYLTLLFIFVLMFSALLIVRLK